MKKLVSIGMPVYNCSRFISQTLISIINQSYKEWELIIIDDHSTDNTIEIIQEFKDYRIKLFKNKINKGLPYCLNKCIDLCNGKYFARMDGDDIMIPDRLTKQIDFLENNPEIDVVGGYAYVIDINNHIIGSRNNQPPKNLKKIINSQHFFIHPTVMGKTEWFLRNKYDENILRSQDFELWLRAFQNSKFHVLDDYLLFYREVGSNFKKKYYQVYLNLKKILNKHREKISTLQYYKNISKAYLKYLFFELFMYLGILLPKQQISIEKIEEIEIQLIKAIKR